MVRKATNCGLLIALCLIAGCDKQPPDYEVYIQTRGERLIILKRPGGDAKPIIIHVDRLPAFTPELQLVPKVLPVPLGVPAAPAATKEDAEPCECDRRVCDPMCYGGFTWPTVPALGGGGAGADAGTGSDAAYP